MTPSDPIRRLFVANRGEIAVRIRRTCERLRVEAIVPPTEGPAALDLLDASAVVAAARAAGAGAVHPGFGFLAENAEFADAVERAGMRWVGPPPEAIRAMGNKATARRLAAELSVPTVPGSEAPDQSDDALRAEAERVGFPVLVKPAAGGGGKGIRVAAEPGELHEAVAAARREARAAFDDDRLILERFLGGPRHVEVQVLFDGHGNGIHLGERDCSLQRRHQKVLEETPSPAVDEAVRARLTDAALRLARAVGYVSAGTCEFLLEDDGQFYFLEMNTRLQVEHPVTELVTGRDLVADQLRIAAGEPLGIDQDAVVHRGHACEVRLYAEDAESGFLPATGRIEQLRWPVGDGIRVDAGIELGSEISGRFDPMLAKIVAHGVDRREAFERLATALDATVVLGLVTNLRFLRWLVRHPVIRDGDARIDTLERIWPPHGQPAGIGIPAAAWETAAAAFHTAGAADPWRGGWRINGPPVIRLAADGEERAVRIPPGRAADGSWVRDAGTVHVDVAGRSVSFTVAPPPDVDRAARAAATLAGGAQPAELTAPMPGAVLVIHVPVGGTVQGGDPVVTLEAMKMEHVVSAPHAGRIGELHVAPGDQVGRGQALASVTVRSE